MIIIISNYSISPISVCASSRHGFLKERVFNLYAMALFHAGIWGLGNLGPKIYRFFAFGSALCYAFGSAFAASVLRFCCAFDASLAALLLRRCGVFATLLCSAFAASLLRFCGAFAALLRRCCCAFRASVAAPWLRLDVKACHELWNDYSG